MVEAACVLIRQLHIVNCAAAADLLTVRCGRTTRLLTTRPAELLADRARQSPPPSAPPPSGSPMSAGAGAGPSTAAGRRNPLIRHRQLRTRDPAGRITTGEAPRQGVEDAKLGTSSQSVGLWSVVWRAAALCSATPPAAARPASAAAAAPPGPES